jgi:L-alanine-DL-glutamate epimerase-like enolase superfamily enzyme
LEEPFVSGALAAYRELAGMSAPIKLAGGEGCHSLHQAKNMIDYAGLGYIQIDTGRIGGITTAKQVADYAEAKGVCFVNHTFTTSLALSASLQPYAGLAGHELCEYPAQPSALAQELTLTRILPDAQGRIHLPEGPGLGLEPDLDAIKKYLVPVEIRVAGKVIFYSPAPR